MNINFQYAIFDLDGTLLNSTHVWHKVDEVFLSKRNLELPTDYVDNIAFMSLNEAAVYTVNRFNLNEKTEDIIKEWHELTLYEYSHNIQLKDYALDFLNYLKNNNVKMAVATGLPHLLFEPVLKRLGIDAFFEHCVSVDDVGKGKAHPDLYLHTAKLLGAKPKECMVFEDVINAMQVAKGIGMKVCAVWDKASDKVFGIEKTADCYIKSWSELLEKV